MWSYMLIYFIYLFFFFRLHLFTKQR